MVIKSNKALKSYKIVLSPEFVRFGADKDGTEAITRTFDQDTLYIRGTDSYVASGVDFDYFCIRAADGSTCFTVPAYKVRYCSERQRTPKKSIKVIGPIADKGLRLATRMDDGSKPT